MIRTGRQTRQRWARRGWARPLLAITVAAVAVLVGTPGGVGAQDRSFSFDSLDTQALVTPTGELVVIEELTFSFDGSFSYISRELELRPSQSLRDVEVTDEAGQPLAFTDNDQVGVRPGGGRHLLEWYDPVSNETRTWTLRYTITDALRVGPDVAELYWQAMGTRHPGLGQADVVVTMPGDGTDLRAWAHGPLDGVVSIAGPVVTLVAADVPSGRFIEVRSTVPTAEVALPATTSGPILPGILEEEERWAAEANAERDRLATELQRKDLLAKSGVGAAVVGLVLFGLVWWGWGREYPHPDDIGEYWREPPEYSPALVMALRRWGTVPNEALGATIVDLAQRGYLVIEEYTEERRLRRDRTGYRFHRTPKPLGGPDLSPYDTSALYRLFANGLVTTQDEQVEWAKKNQKTAHKWWEGWKRSVHTDYAHRHWVDSTGRALAYAVAAIVILGLGAWGVLALAWSQSLLGLIPLGVSVVLMAVSPTLRRRSKAGRREHAKVEGLRRFLRDFSRLDEAVSGDLILYERYLVFAVALGVSAELATALAAKVPALVEQGNLAWYVSPTMGYARLASIGSIGTMAASFGSAVAAASTPRSSGSGAGGGFSGGGGGGFGGGGVGAR